jgi:hypothetical protein
MQRGRTTYWRWRVAAVLAVTTALSCGTGIRTTEEQEVAVSRTIDSEGFDLKLGEGTLNVWKNCLDSPTLITLRRFHSYDHHLGAVGPVFEIEIPAPDTFTCDPRIVIETSSAIANNGSPVIGFLVPGGTNEQWVPDSTPANPSCTKPNICGPVQNQSFTSPGGGTLDPTNRLEFAIIETCGGPSDCGSRQTCTSGACQECQTNGLCNPPTP